MMGKTFGMGLRSVIVLSLFPLIAMNLWCKASGSGRGDAQETARLTISVYNDAEVPVNVLGRAEDQAEQVFRQAGIEVAWLNCRVPAVSEEASRACREADYPKHLHLRIVGKSVGLKAEAMGISFQAEDGSGCSADLFYEPMEQLQKSHGTDLASLLGHVAAHEIGHLLLGTNSHATAGIMQARWTAEELTGAKIGALVFSEQESLRMKARLAAAMPGLKEGPLTAAGRVSGRIHD